MQRLLALMVIATVVTDGAGLAGSGGVLIREANAKPRRDLADPFDSPRLPCRSGKTWKVIERCLDKELKVSVPGIEILFDRETAKVVAVPLTSAMKNVILYFRRSNEWVRGGLALRTSESVELTSVGTMTTPLGDAIRVESSYTAWTAFSLVPGAPSVRGVLRRRFTHVCVDSGARCLMVQTACDAYVGGKAYWTFRGEPVWHPTLGLRVRGDPRIAGGLCAPSPSMLLEDERP